ncbi:MAG: acetate uptake transporter [Bacteriovoracaceae bacterium]|nr:acetate uptake transporter [Bacteriovoracaceae bacterium]
MNDVRTLKDTSANPAPLGLLGFGLTTILLNIHNAGFFPLDSMIISMGMFVGGTAQLIAGVLESKKGNTFGTVAFTLYGSFWLSLVAIWLLPNIDGVAAASTTSMGFYLLLWGIFSFGMFIGTLKLNRALQLVFGSLVVLFFLLALKDFTGIGWIGTVAGFEGILCGASAMYLAIAEILNELYDRELLPIGTVS